MIQVNSRWRGLIWRHVLESTAPQRFLKSFATSIPAASTNAKGPQAAVLQVTVHPKLRSIIPHYSLRKNSILNNQKTLHSLHPMQYDIKQIPLSNAGSEPSIELDFSLHEISGRRTQDLCRETLRGPRITSRYHWLPSPSPSRLGYISPLGSSSGSRPKNAPLANAL
jgi:hypothetical protein